MNTLFCLFAFFSFHEFYVSTSYMEYNDKKQSIQVQKKIFFDDFEIALRKFTGDEYFDIIKSIICFSRIFKFFTIASLDTTAISAAADGVGARTSDTKSEIEKSVSWPTAEIIGIRDLNIALATISSLNAHKSSIEPPPLPIIRTSTQFLELNNSIALEI